MFFFNELLQCFCDYHINDFLSHTPCFIEIKYLYYYTPSINQELDNIVKNRFCLYVAVSKFYSDTGIRVFFQFVIYYYHRLIFVIKYRGTNQRLAKMYK